MRLLSTTALVSLLAAPALAEPLADATPQVEEVIVTAPRLAERLPPVEGARIFAAKKAAVADLEQLPPVAVNNLRQAFSQLPGLLVSEVSNGSWASLSHRGLGEPHESWNLLTLRDGVPLSPDMYFYPAAYYTPPLESVARLAFVRGGAGLLYGPQPGGALNYISPEPPDADGMTGEVRLRAGSDALRTAYGSAQGREGRLFGAVWAEAASGEGPRRRNSDFDRTSLTATAGADLSERVRAALTVDLYRGRFGEPGGLSPVRYYADLQDVSTPLDRLRIERAAVSGRIDIEVDSETQVEVLAFASYFDRLSRRQAGGSFGQVTPAANVSVVQGQTFRTGGLDVRARRDFGFGAAGRGTSTAGVLLYRSDAPVKVDKGATPTDWNGAAGALARTEREGTVVALFGETLLDFGRLSLVPGLRLERVEQSVTERLDLNVGSATGGGPGGANGPLESRSETETVLLYGLGASWSLGAASELFANVSRGFKPKLYNDGVTFQAGVSAAPTFEPTYTLTWEAGVRGDPRPWLSAEASAFLVRFDDQVGFLAGPLPAAPPFGAVGAGGARRLNVGDMENKGVEGRVELDLLGLAAARRGQAAPASALRLYGNVQLLDAEFVDGPAKGFTPQYAPPYLVRAGLAWSGARGAKAAVQATWVGEHEGSDNNRPEFRIPAYAVLDVSAELPLTERVSLVGGVGNLFDERYFARVRPGGGAGIDPGAPRTWNVGLSAAF